MQQPAKARFDGQLPSTQKQYFERAAEIGGFRTLTEFIFTSAQEKAEEIIERDKMLLETERDRNVFFAAIMDAPAPNDKLKKAAADYKVKLGNE